MDEEVTITSLRVTVSDEESYHFALGAAHDVTSSIRLTHITYTPPKSRAEWEAYYDRHPELPRPTFAKDTISVAARVRTLTYGNEIKSFVVACFPLDTQRISIDSHSGAAASSSKKGDTTSAVRLGGLFDVAMPLPTDIVSGLNVRLDVDGSATLEVEGPGRVTFVGEQFSALIPEWMNHGMFRVGPDGNEVDEEFVDSDEIDEDELAEMFRLAR